MLQFLSRWACALSLVMALVVVSGCDPVVEDRTVSFSSDGKSASFQHGKAGVFVADPATGRLESVFTPDESVIACSTPLFAPGREQLIFTTARAADQNAPLQPQMDDWNNNPEGRAFGPQEIIYTCWLRENPQSAPVPLFEGHCDHAGYVAANLAVRWHPQHDRVAYIDRVGPQQLSVFEYDLKSKSVRRMFPYRARAVLFDWDPTGRLMSCLIDDPVNDVPEGLWVGDPESADWRNVLGPVWEGPNTRIPLGIFKGMRPAWTADGERLAFIGPLGKGANGSPNYGLFLSDPDGSHTRQLAESAGQLADLRWSADGALLGSRNPETSSLAMYARDGRPVEGLAPQQVSQFSGWNATGERLAYVVSAQVDVIQDADWAFVLRAHPHAQDVLRVTDRTAQQAGTTVFSGMRVTFASWSPEPHRISFWGTFVPVVQSWWEWGLRPGDPAAVADLDTGEVTWMPVNATEKAQIGHWFLSQQKYAEADKWYREADAAEADAEKERTETDGVDAAKTNPAPDGHPLAIRGWQFFHALCLSKLGRDAEAQELFEKFRESYQPFAKVEEPDVRNTLAAMVNSDDPQQIALLTDLLRNLYIAQVFLSINAADDGVAWFRRELAQAEGNRLALALPLSQILLLTGRRDEYLELASQDIVPLAISLPTAASEPNGQLPQLALPLSSLLSLLPLCSAEFLAKLSDDAVTRLAERWTELRPRASSDQTRLGVALLLEAAERRRGNTATADALAAEIRANPAGSTLTPDNVAEFIKLLRGLRNAPNLLLPGVR